MRLPMVSKLLQQLFKKPATNLFPAKYLPDSITDYFQQVAEGKATINPPIPVAEDHKGKISYDATNCIGCSLCAKVCPAQAIDVHKKKKTITIYVAQCISCGQCIDICPKDCIALTKDFLTANGDRYDESLIVGEQPVNGK